MGKMDYNDEPTVEFRFLGHVDFDRWHSLQNQLIRSAVTRRAPQIDVVFCEHPPLITIGRLGSRARVRLSDEQLRRRQLQVRWIGRGGGCILHAPGQLAVYPIVPLDVFGWTVGDYMRRLQAAMIATLRDMRIPIKTQSGRFGIAGRTGQMVVFGVAARHGVTGYGALINVNPAMNDFGYVDVVEPNGNERATMSCLVAERQRPVRMSEVRSTLVENLAEAFDCPRYHMQTGHPLLPRGKSIA